MKIAICGEDQILEYFIESISNRNDFEIDCVIPFAYNQLRFENVIDEVDFFEFIRRYKSARCDAIIIAMSHATMKLMKNFIRRLKLHDVEKIGIFFGFFDSISITWLDQEKFTLPYLEVNVVDGCNLNCKGCSHFSPLFGLDEVYRLEDFERASNSSYIRA